MYDNLLDREIDAMVADALERARPVAAPNTGLKVTGSYPSVVISAEDTLIADGVEKAINRSVIRFSGDALIFEDNQNGVSGSYTYTILGDTITGGVVRVAGVRTPGTPGFLFWEYEVDLNLAAGAFSAVFQTTVNLIHSATISVSTIPEARANSYNDVTDATVAVSPGTIHQLCAAYDARGVAIVFNRRPTGPFASGNQPYQFTG